MKRKMINGLFLLTVALVLCSGLAATVFRPKDVNYYENRPANKLGALSVSSFLDTTFQQSAEDALSDQIPLAQTYKHGYNYLNSRYTYSVLSDFIQANPDRYISASGLLLFGGDYLVYETRPLSGEAENLAKHAENINAVMAANPGVEYYVYFIEKDYDLNLETGERTGTYEYIRDRLELDKRHIGNFEIDSFETYAKFFYKTDHHWNYKGSYQAYREVAQLLGITDVLEPVEEVDLGLSFSGSKASTVGASDVLSEEFIAYRFDYPDMDICIDGAPVSDYGAQESYFQGGQMAVSYGSFYGGDDGEILFDTHRPEKKNVLVLGESYDNAVVKLLASGCNRLYSVDLRNWEDFSLSEYLADKEIDQVLWIGSLSFFVSDPFLMEE